MGTTVGPSAYFLNFSSYGLQINAGHEVLLDRAWLGEVHDYRVGGEGGGGRGALMRRRSSARGSAAAAQRGGEARPAG